MRKIFCAALFGSCLAAAGASQAALPMFDSQGESLPTLAPMVKSASPAVVNIAVVATRTVQNPLLQDPAFRRFFNVPPGQNGEQKRRTQSAGSGVIVDADKGIVVTNHHVVDGADEISVGLADGRSVKAKLIGSDDEVDIAVLQIKADRLTALPMTDSDKLQVGDFVVAMGNPFGLGQTVTSGVVSATGRSGLGIEGYEDFIQTDASINPGNSGGALVNLRGQLVGINTAILAPSGGNVGIGFAIPTNMMRSSLEQILEHGSVQRGVIGVVIQDLTPELAEAFGIQDVQRGVLIAQVQEGSTADKAGVKAGDVVTAVDGKPVTSGSGLRAAIGAKRVEDKVRLALLRDGKSQDVSVRVGKRSDQQQAAAASGLFSGVQLGSAPGGEGVLVSGLEPDSRAAAAGLRPGDVIISANRMRVNNVAELQAIASKGQRLLLQILRDGGAFYIVLR